MSGQPQAPAALLPGKQPPVPIGHEAGEPESVRTQWKGQSRLPLPKSKYFSLKSTLCVVMPCSLEKGQRFEGTPLQSASASKSRQPAEAGVKLYNNAVSVEIM
jgi:hypothetical protein